MPFSGQRSKGRRWIEQRWPCTPDSTSASCWTSSLRPREAEVATFQYYTNPRVNAIGLSRAPEADRPRSEGTHSGLKVTASAVIFDSTAGEETLPVAAEQVRIATGEHVVQFYGRDEDLVDTVVPYLLSALLRDEVAVVIAVEPHRAAFESALEAKGLISPSWRGVTDTSPSTPP